MLRFRVLCLGWFSSRMETFTIGYLLITRRICLRKS
nr:MAG TPA: hypothetical protein [Caudoviricetes sp.]DAZ23769.1 MAG TPA: hypothetical protein [Caudoviricetes sp.]